MDIRTLSFVNLIFLFLYAAFVTINFTVHGRIRGGIWFVLSNVSRGFAGILFAFGGFLPHSVSVLLADLLLAVGLALLHRSFAELLGRSRSGWTLQLAAIGAVPAGAAASVFLFHNYNADLFVVSVASACQLALTGSLILATLTKETRVAVSLTFGILLLYALAEMTRAVIVLRSPSELTHFSSLFVILLLLGALLANGGTTFAFLFLSASQLRRELIRLAHHDALTGVLNRRGLYALAERRLTATHRASEPVSIVSLDLDGMKTANDTWGHECGDTILRSVAAVLVATVGSRGAVARLGGDEFVIVLPGMAESGAYEIAESLRCAIERLRVPNGRPRASFGVASMYGCNWQDAVRKSDQALIQAKTAGRNRVMAYA